MTSKQIHTSGNRKSGYRNTRAGKILSTGTKKAMVKSARELAKAKKLIHVIHAKNGRFEACKSY